MKKRIRGGLLVAALTFSLSVCPAFVYADAPWPETERTDSHTVQTDYFVIVNSENPEGTSLYTSIFTGNPTYDPDPVPNGSILYIAEEITDRNDKVWGNTEYKDKPGYVALEDCTVIERDQAILTELENGITVEVEYDIPIDAENGCSPVFSGPGKKYGIVTEIDPIENGETIHVYEQTLLPDGSEWVKTIINDQEVWIPIENLQQPPTIAEQDIMITKENDEYFVDLEATNAKTDLEVDAPAAVSAATPTPEPTCTATPTPMPTSTNTPTPKPTSTNTPTPEPTSTNTPTPKPTSTNTPTPEPTSTNTPTPKPTDTNTPTPKPTDTNTPTPDPTNTDTPTSDLTNTSALNPANANISDPDPTNTNTPAPDPTNTNTPAPDPTSTDTPTPDPANTNTPAPDPTSTDTPAPDPTNTDAPTQTPKTEEVVDGAEAGIEQPDKESGEIKKDEASTDSEDTDETKDADETKDTDTAKDTQKPSNGNVSLAPLIGIGLIALLLLLLFFVLHKRKKKQ